jgi:twitching motility protein PilT
LSNQPIDQPIVADGRVPRLDAYFRAMVTAGASDLHLKAGSPPHTRVDTRIVAAKHPPLGLKELHDMAMELLSIAQQAYLADNGSIDVAYEIPGSDRFRINIYRQRGTLAIAVRRVTRMIPSFDDLHVPPILRTLAQEHQGLILLSGPTGSGKSTTIAAMIEYINQTRPCHIVTIEDPIEYLYEDKKAVVNQREIGIDTHNFESALKYLMREDPDVVLIGEMRDRETFSAALQASETGHLVLGTVHASSAPQTITRLLDLFPQEGRELVRQSLGFNLKAVICQRLLQSVAQGVQRIPAVEIMIMNPSVKQLLQEGRDAELADVIRAHEREGMQSFTSSLRKLIEQELIDPKVAYEAAPNVDELKMLMKGISAGRAGLMR